MIEDTRNISKSNKIRNISLIVDYITKSIVENQNIKRMLKYNTQNPLSTRGIAYDGTRVDQPDIVESLLDKSIYNICFNPNMSSMVENSLYVSVSDGRFARNTSTVNIEINILVDEKYSNIANGKREVEIGQEVCMMLDNVKIIEEEFVRDLGNLEFELTRMYNSRLSKTNNVLWLCLVFEVDYLSRRN